MYITNAVSERCCTDSSHFLMKTYCNFSLFSFPPPFHTFLLPFCSFSPCLSLCCLPFSGSFSLCSFPLFVFSWRLSASCSFPFGRWFSCCGWLRCCRRRGCFFFCLLFLFFFLFNNNKYFKALVTIIIMKM